MAAPAARLAILLFALLLLALSGSPVARAADEAGLIAQVMKSTWEKPGAPLTVEPVVVSNSYAMAGWAQGDRGGRALLRREHGKWVVFVCGGDDLKSARAIEGAGVPLADAARLAKLLSAAEARTSPVLLGKFATFQGIVNVAGDPAHGGMAGHGMQGGHGAQQGHGAHDAPAAPVARPAAPASK
jgi:hypothetical protein